MFKHSCEHCTFLGRFNNNMSRYDLYVCKQGDRLIGKARFGNDDHMVRCGSLKNPVHRLMKEIEKRAKALESVPMR